MPGSVPGSAGAARDLQGAFATAAAGRAGSRPGLGRRRNGTAKQNYRFCCRRRKKIRAQRRGREQKPFQAAATITEPPEKAAVALKKGRPSGGRVAAPRPPAAAVEAQARRVDGDAPGTVTWTAPGGQRWRNLSPRRWRRLSPRGPGRRPAAAPVLLPKPPDAAGRTMKTHENHKKSGKRINKKETR